MKPKRSMLHAYSLSSCLVIVLTIAVSGCGLSTKLPFPGKEAINKTAQQAEIDAAIVVDDFIRKMAVKDVKAAYDLFSTRAKTQILFTDTEKMVAGDNYQIFSDYDKLEVKDSNYGTHIESNSQITFIQMTGVVTYTGGFTGTFDSTLEDENGKWRLISVKILAPPEKTIKFNAIDEEKQAKTKLVELRSRWNAQNFESIFKDGGSTFRVEEQKNQIIAGMGQAFGQYGEFEKILDEKVRIVANFPLQVRIALHTKFQKAEVSERFTFIKINSEYKLGGYSIEAKNMDLDELLSNKY